MAPDPTEDPDDEDYETAASSARRNMWTPAYLRRFTSLLRDLPAILNHAGNGNENVLAQKRLAMETMSQELGFQVPELQRRLILFKKVAFNKMCSVVARCGAEASSQVVLKAAPKWLRDLEPQLGTMPRARAKLHLRQNKAIWCGPKVAVAAPPLVTPSVPPSAPPRPVALAAALADSARAQRTLEARAVCSRVPGVPPESREQLQFVWWRMLDVVREKLALQWDSGSGGDAASSGALRGAEPVLADLLLLLDDSMCTLGSDSDVQHCAVALFNLAQLHRLEECAGQGDALARWRRALANYRSRYCDERFSSLVLLQRRWHELKTAARRALHVYRSVPPAAAATARLSPLHAAILNTYPHVVTQPLSTWRDLVQSGRVVEDMEEDPATAPILAPDELELSKQLDLAQYSLTAKEEEDDLIVIEKEIETIDLINASEREAGSLSPAEPALRGFKRESEMPLATPHVPEGRPLFIYESDEDVQCEEDRRRNIDAIAAQLRAEDIKLEPAEQGEVKGEQGEMEGQQGEVEEEHDPPEDDEPTEIDVKLLMIARVPLVRVDATGGWLRSACAGAVDVRTMDLALLGHRPPPPSAPTPPPPVLTVKQEKIDDYWDSLAASGGSGERHVKGMARRRIAELLRDEDDPTPTPTPPGQDDRRAKKVNLLNIEEVRRTNKGMLTAQVAPLTPKPEEGGPADGGGEDALEGGADAEGFTEWEGEGDGEGALHIDEGAGDVTITPDELQRVLLASRESKRDVGVGVGVDGGLRHAKFCCPARRERALNAARHRCASRAGRPRPATILIHDKLCGGVASGAGCRCCCKHLLQMSEAAARLQREADDIHHQLATILDWTSVADNGTTNKVRKSGPSSRRKKPTDPGAGAVAPPPVGFPLDAMSEWNRQKNLNSQYFNLNLTPAPPRPAPAAPRPATPSASTSDPAPAAPTLSPRLLLDPHTTGRVPLPQSAGVQPLACPPPATDLATDPVATITIIKCAPGDVGVPALVPRLMKPNTVPRPSCILLGSRPTPAGPRGPGTQAALTGLRPRALSQPRMRAPAPVPNAVVTPRGKDLKIFKIVATTEGRSLLRVDGAGPRTPSPRIPSPRAFVSPVRPAKQPRLAPAPAPRAFVSPVRPAKLPRLAPAPAPRAAAPRAAAPPRPPAAVTPRGQRVVVVARDTAGLRATQQEVSAHKPPVLAALSSPPGGRLPGARVLNAGVSPGAEAPTPLLEDEDIDGQTVLPADRYKRIDVTTSVDGFLRGRDPTAMVVQCVDPTATLLTLQRGTSYLLTESPLQVIDPHYWSLTAPHKAKRIIFDHPPSTSHTSTSTSTSQLKECSQPGPRAALPSVVGTSSASTSSASTSSASTNSASSSTVPPCPDKMCLENKVYVKLKDQPLLYARVMFCIRSVRELRAELSRGAAVFAVTRGGDLTRVSRDKSPGGGIICPDAGLAAELAGMLRRTSAPAEPAATEHTTSGGGGSGAHAAAAAAVEAAAEDARAAARARAQVALVLSNVQRRPIELVHIDSDDDDADSNIDFKGLENFEDMDVFEL